MTLPPKRLMTQERLRTAVQELLLMTDWCAITVQHVAEQAGVSIGTFYNYYDSKDEALADVRQCLSSVVKNDLAVLLASQSAIECRVSLLLKYFVNIANAKPTWANYFYRSEAFNERLDGGLSAQLEPMVVELSMAQTIAQQDAEMVTSFIENGLFPLLKECHEQGRFIEEAKAAQMVQWSLAALGLTGDALNHAAHMPCPVTPLAELPLSIFELERVKLGYV